MPSKPSADFPLEPVPAGKGTRRQVLIGPDMGPNFALRKFIMEPGGGMPLHSNKVEHEQYVLAGRARVVIGDEVQEVQKDDVVFIPGGVPHSYEALGDEPFEFLCVVPNLPDETTLLQEDAADARPGVDVSSSIRPKPTEGRSEKAEDRSDAAEAQPNAAENPLVIPEDELGC